MRTQEQVKRKIQKHLEKVNEYKIEVGCQRCGENHIACLDFHHINPTEKEYSISQMLRKNMDRIWEEIDKCEVLCSNCHRILHYELKHIEEF